MLLDILRMVKEETGLKYDTSPSEKLLGIARINRAGEELHRMFDLQNSIKEEVFNIQTGSQQVTLPYYVGVIRGCRYYDSRLRVPIDALNNRYGSGFGNETWYLKFREKEDSVLQREISNQSILKFSVPLAETSDVIFTVAGPTANASRAKETVVIPAGILTENSIGNFKSPLTFLSKNRVTKYDITIKDVEDNILAIFANTVLTLKYRVLQITDSPYLATPNSLSALEIQFKIRYTPLVEDTDTFVCGDIYDFAVFTKYMEHRARTIPEAQAWNSKCSQLVLQVWEDLRAGKRETIDFVPHGAWFDMPYSYFSGDRSYGYGNTNR